jgi:serine/threonine-protein kinase
VLYLLRQVCESLAEAHEAGLIHRDIKPANIYVCRRAREVDFVKVLDFGMVKHGGEVPEGADQLSGAMIVAGGTPAYMAPEQAVGEANVDGRADIYSLGCVAYWLLTGGAVFSGRTVLETMMMHVHRAPEPPSSRTAVPVSPGLEQIVMACLEKDPELRPRTADELAERLAAVRLPEEWTTARARAWWAAHGPAVSDRYPRPTKPDSRG